MNPDPVSTHRRGRNGRDRWGLPYIGTDRGVHKSASGGATWAVIAAGLPNVAVQQIALNRVRDTLFALTHGWSADRSARAPIVLVPYLHMPIIARP